MLKRNILLGLDIFLSLVIFLSIVTIVNDKSYNSDFRSFYLSAKIFITDKKNLYNLQTQYNKQYDFIRKNSPDERFVFLPFVYPPVTLIPFIPLTLFDFKTAYLFAFYLMIAQFMVNIYLFFKIFKPKIAKFRMILLSFSFGPAILALGHIQYSFLMLFVFILTYVFFKKSNFFLAGFLGSLLLLKIQIGMILIIYFLLFGNNKVRLGVILGTVLICLINLMLIGFDIFPFLKINYWYAVVAELFSNSALTQVSYWGFLSFLKTYLNFIPTFQIGAFLSFATIIFTFYIFTGLDKSKRFSASSFSLIIVTTLLASPHMHYHNVVLLLFPFFWVYSRWSYLKVHLLIAAGWITMFFGSFSPYNLYLVFFHPTLFLLVVYYLLIKDLNNKSFSV